MLATLGFFATRGPVSFSAAQGTGWWVLTIALLSVAAALLVLAATVRELLQKKIAGPEASARAACVVLGASPPTLLCFVLAGFFVPRIGCEPGWWAALPLFSFAANGGVAIAAALIAVVALTRPSTVEV